jgi:hypothetical protein
MKRELTTSTRTSNLSQLFQQKELLLDLMSVRPFRQKAGLHQGARQNRVAMPLATHPMQIAVIIAVPMTRSVMTAMIAMNRRLKWGTVSILVASVVQRQPND